MSDADLTTIPAELLAALDADEPEAPVRQNQKRYTPMEQLQIAIWLLEGVTNDKVRAMCERQGIAPPSDGTLWNYRRNESLREQARQYLRREFTTAGLAERAVRVRKLQRLSERLEEKMDQMDLMEEAHKLISFGKSQQSVIEKKFANTLVREYRETLEQIRREVEPLERIVVNENTTTVLLASVTDDDKRQIIDALKWVPKALPQIVVSEEPVDGDFKMLDSPDPATSE